MRTQNDWIEEVHHYWFSELKSADWYRSDPVTDATIRELFLGLYEQLKADSPEASNPLHALAAVIALDQFPRNMFRGTAAAFETDSSALRLARVAVAAKFDHSLAPEEKQFLYMPYMHSEDRDAQQESISLFTSLGPELAGYARQHKEIIDRFGRFPYRNAILGRSSTPEEIEFLRSGSPFG